MLHFKTFETFVPRRTENRDQQIIMKIVEAQTKLSELLADPNNVQLINNFLHLAAKVGNDVDDLIHRLSKGNKSPDISQIKPFYIGQILGIEAKDFFMFSVLDKEQYVEMLSYTKRNDSVLNVYSSSNSLKEAIRKKLLNREGFVVPAKGKKYDVILEDSKQVEHFYLGKMEADRLNKKEYNWYHANNGFVYIASQILGITGDMNAEEFFEYISEENPNYVNRLNSAFIDNIANVRRRSGVDEKEITLRDMKESGLMRLRSATILVSPAAKSTLLTWAK